MQKQKVNIDYNNPVISIRGVKKAFEDYAVLRGIDLDLFQGENLVVLGRSGTGKSVLIKLVSGLLKPDAGTINVLGNEVTEISDRELQELRILGEKEDQAQADEGRQPQQHRQTVAPQAGGRLPLGPRRPSGSSAHRSPHHQGPDEKA